MRVSEPDNSDSATAGMQPEEALSETEVIERIRGRAAAATPATQEFRRRHLPAVLAYARLCSRDSDAAAALATQAFTLAVREIRRGINAPGTWRHRLLILVQQTAVSWSSDSRRDHLAPSFVACIEATGSPIHDRPLPLGTRPRDAALLDAFHSLPERTRGILWHAVIEAEPDSEVAAQVGVEPSALDALQASAHKALQKAYLRAHLERNGSQTCGRFQRLIEAATEPSDLRRSPDLERHMSVCSCCTLAVAQLFRLKQDPGGALADGLLGWGSAAYLATAPTHARTQPQPPQSDAAVPATAPVVLPPARRPRALHGRTGVPAHQRGRRVLGATAVVAAVVVAAVVALLPDDHHHPDQIARPLQPPHLTAAATSSHAAPATNTPPSPSTSASPTPTPTPTPTHQHTRAPSPPPIPRPRSNVNLAIHKTVAASSHTQDYVPSNAVDGDTSTYWEATNHVFPQWFEIDLGSAADVRRLVMNLPPLEDWNRRHQTITIEGSMNGYDWRTVVPATSYFFDAAEGNTATVTPASPTRTRYLKLVFSANTGWPAAQLSELQLFAS
ncbi:discoidin domain-containing protein [Streptomyces collinus]|uniref:discoidin domain-containing protein n=1 Tax=Streptomyces collinus TaxID=42684 RepID=UPI00294372C9|nr:discoidin domain-containing protein [Streptomyces collinus]